MKFRLPALLASVLAISACVEGEEFAAALGGALESLAETERPFIQARDMLRDRAILLEQGSFAAASSIQFTHFNFGQMTFIGAGGQGEGMARLERGTSGDTTPSLCLRFGSIGSPENCFPVVIDGSHLTLTHSAGGTSRWRIVDAAGTTVDPAPAPGPAPLPMPQDPPSGGVILG